MSTNAARSSPGVLPVFYQVFYLPGVLPMFYQFSTSVLLVFYHCSATGEGGEKMESEGSRRVQGGGAY